MCEQQDFFDHQPVLTTLTPMKSVFQREKEPSPVNYGNGQNYDDVDDDEGMDGDFNDKNGDSITSNEPCLVCGGVAKGLHFQVNSCRACAAFFRRSTKSKLVYRCQRGTGRCDLTVKVKGKPLCRYCRMKKCTSVGMRIESESIPSLESTHNSPPSTIPEETASLQVSYKDMPRSEIRLEGKRIVYNTQPLVSLVKDSLQQNRSHLLSLPRGITITPMQKMNYAISRFVNSLTPKIGDIQIVTEIGADCGMRFQEEYILKLIDVLTSCDYFVNLPACDKFPLFKRFWTVFQQLERGYQTMVVFGSETNDYRFIIDDKKAVDMDLDKVKITGMPASDLNNVMKLFEPIRERMFTHLMNPLKTIRPTIFEIAYMAQQILWSCFEISGLTPETYKVAEEVLERSSNEIHNYYVYDMRITNYASRHASILKLIAVSEFIIRSKKDMMIMAKVFDVLENDFFDSELFQ
uniref:Uncharacterized protein n=1 Tax=Panagrolaimus sp. ES5 TaxID=591445 RepID=A0AC34F389_9BILA